MLDAVGRWDADTDIDMHNIAAYSQHLGRLWANCSVYSHTCGPFSLLHIIFIHSPVCYHLQLIPFRSIFMIPDHTQLNKVLHSYSYDS